MVKTVTNHLNAQNRRKVDHRSVVVAVVVAVAVVELVVAVPNVPLVVMTTAIALVMPQTRRSNSMTMTISSTN